MGNSSELVANGHQVNDCLKRHCPQAWMSAVVVLGQLASPLEHFSTRWYHVGVSFQIGKVELASCPRKSVAQAVPEENKHDPSWAC
jgi:hypothetical protein